jgi:hypothetical protein
MSDQEGRSAGALLEESGSSRAHHPIVKNEYKRIPMKARNTTRLR